MPLQTQVIGVPITGGLNTRPDERDLPSGDLKSANNVEFRRGNSIKKRNGLVQFTNSVSGKPDGTTVLNNGRGVFSDGQNLFCSDGKSIYVYEESASQWRRLAAMWDADIELKDIVGLTGIIYNGLPLFGPSTCGVSTRFLAYATIAPPAILTFLSPVFAQIFVTDRLTGNIVSANVTNFHVPSTITDNQRIRCVTVNDHILFLFANDDSPSTISCVGVHPTTGVITLRWKITDGDHTRFFDVGGVFSGGLGISSFTQAIIAYTTPTGLRVRQFTETAFSVIQTNELAGVTTENDIAIAVGTSTAPSNTFVVAYGRSNATTRLAVAGFNFDATLTTRFGPNGKSFSFPVRQIVGIITRPTVGTRFTLFYDVRSSDLFGSSNVDPKSAQIFRYSASDMDTVSAGPTTSIVNGMSIASKPWCSPRADLTGSPIGQVCFGSMIDSETQGSLYVTTEGPLDPITQVQIDTLPAIGISRIGGGKIQRFNASDVALLGSQFTLNADNTPAPVVFSESVTSNFVSLTINNSIPIPQQGLSAVTFTENTSKRFSAKRGLVGSFILGSKLMYYDNNVLNDLGLPFPVVAVLGSVTPGGLVSGETYTYKATISFVDNNGRTHESAPSLAVSALLLAGQTSVSARIQFPCSLQTLGFSLTESLSINLYRTQASGSTFRLVGSIPFLIFAGLVTSVTDTFSDADIAAQPLLYTESGEVPNGIIPSPNSIELRNGRLFATVGSNELWFSKTEDLDTGLAFSDVLINVLPTQYGDAVTLSILDDKLIIFHERASYVLTGDGPNSLAQGEFFGPSLITGTLGTVVPRSVIDSEYGIFFQSPRGIYLLDRSLSYSYVGQKISNYTQTSDNENENNFVVVDAVFVSDKSQARFMVSSPVDGTSLGILVFDLQQSKWSSFTTEEISESYLFSSSYKQNQNERYYITMDALGRFKTEDNTSFLDFSYLTSLLSTYSILIETGWIHVGGMQGFTRLKRVGFLAQTRSINTTNIQLSFNYDELNNVQNVPFSSSPLNQLFQYRVKPIIQKIESIKFLVFDATAVVDGGASFDSYEFSLEIAGKSGIFRLPASNSK